MTVLRNGEPLPENVKLKAVIRNGMVNMNLDDAQRSDAGNYTLKLTNAMGEVEVPFKIDVYGMSSHLNIWTAHNCFKKDKEFWCFCFIRSS